MVRDAGTWAAPPVRRLQRRLEVASVPEKRDWWTGYLKGAAAFRGVPMGEVRRAVHLWFSEESLDSLSDEELLEVVCRLLRERYTEDKLAGMLLTQEILLPAGRIHGPTALPRWAELFAEGAIADWNACDWFCVKVLGPLIEHEGETCGRTVAAWTTAEGLWQRRAGVVAFVNLVKRPDERFPGLLEVVLVGCATLLKSRERFAQSAVGWVLREASVSHPERVARFVEAHRDRMSREALKNATKRLESKAS